MTTLVSRSPKEMAGGGGSCITSEPKKSSGVSSTVSSVMVMLKHCRGLVGVREKTVEKSPKSSLTEGKRRRVGGLEGRERVCENLLIDWFITYLWQCHLQAID